MDRRYRIFIICILFVLIVSSVFAAENVSNAIITDMQNKRDIAQLNEEIRKLHQRIDHIQATDMTVIGDATLEDIIMSGDLKISNLASGSGALTYVLVDSNNTLYKSVKVFP